HQRVAPKRVARNSMYDRPHRAQHIETGARLRAGAKTGHQILTTCTFYRDLGDRGRNLPRESCSLQLTNGTVMRRNKFADSFKNELTQGFLRVGFRLMANLERGRRCTRDVDHLIHEPGKGPGFIKRRNALTLLAQTAGDLTDGR